VQPRRASQISEGNESAERPAWRFGWHSSGGRLKTLISLFAEIFLTIEDEGPEQNWRPILFLHSLFEYEPGFQQVKISFDS
jgi:hypothetical protein